MTRIQDDLDVDGVPVVRLESAHLRVDVAPEVGGRIISVVDSKSGNEFLWRNEALRLERLAAGTEYDPNFYGGIDELIPNDVPEQIDDTEAPDHGELWTSALTARIEDDQLVLQGALPLTGLTYERRMSLRSDGPQMDLAYRIANPTDRAKHFMWKLHAALAVEVGDVIDCPAQRAQVVDPAWSRYKTLTPFDWPVIEGQRANVIGPKDGTVDFFYLFDLQAGRIRWRRPANGLGFAYRFDTGVFPYAWLFASYGGLDGHYTVVLEPCTTMPISVNEAAGRGQCSSLGAGESLETHVSIYAGPVAKP